MPLDFSTLTAGKTTLGSIANFVNRSDIPVELILTEAQAFIYQRLRVREMMQLDEIAVISGNYKTTVPTGFLDPISLKPYGWGDGLDYVSEDKFLILRETDGTKQTADLPSSFTIIGTDIVFDVELSADLGAELIYYKAPDALSGTNTTNFLTARYPTLVRHSCESFAYEHMKDPARSLEFRKMVEAEIMDASATNDLYRRGQR